MRITSPWLVLLLLVTTSISAKTPSLPHQNESVLSVSRYIDLMPGPTNAQKNPMNLVLPHISFKHNIKSVGQAINYLLSDTGYKLTRFHPDRRVHSLFRLPLPKIHRNMGSLTLAQALTVLAGEPWSLSVDPINRLVSYQLPGHFKVTRHKVKTKHVKANITTSITKQQINITQKQYQRALESKRRALQDRKNKARLVKAKSRKQTINKTNEKRIASKNKSKQSNYQINWSDLPEELR